MPTNLLQYLRPDRISFHHPFPYVGFGGGPLNIGNVARDPELPTASLTSTTTLLLLLAGLGVLVVVVAAVARRLRLEEARVLRLPILAAAASFIPTLMLAEVAERYLADLTPLFVVAGAVGVYVVEVVARVNDRCGAASGSRSSLRC